MCRLLAIKTTEPFDPKEYLEPFAQAASKSKEYQGHGWGISYLENGKLVTYKEILPIWESEFEKFPKTTLLIAHARSAFQDKGIELQNNMPFGDEKLVFVFNGELRGVRIKEEGRIGAEKIFNVIKKRGDDVKEALTLGTQAITRKTKYVRAMNVIMTDREKLFAHCQYNEDPEYFTLHVAASEKKVMISSDSLPGIAWDEMKNGETLAL